MAFSNRVSGRMGLFNHLYGFKRDPNWIPPYCGVAERVFDNYLNAPAVIMGEEGDLTIQRVMQIVQDEYAESVLGSLKAFKGTCLEICGRCPYKLPLLPPLERPIKQSYYMFDAKTKSELTTEIEVDPLLIKAVEEDPCFGDTQSICQPEFGIVTVPGMVCNEVSIGSRRYRESFLAVIAHTLRSPLVAPLIYHPNFIKGKASMAGFDITRRFNVL